MKMRICHILGWIKISKIKIINIPIKKDIMLRINMIWFDKINYFRQMDSESIYWRLEKFNILSKLLNKSIYICILILNKKNLYENQKFILSFKINYEFNI